MSAGERVQVELVDPAQRVALMFAQADADAWEPAVISIARNAIERRQNAAAGILERVQQLPTLLFCLCCSDLTVTRGTTCPACAKTSCAGPGVDYYQGAIRTLSEGGNCTAKTIAALAMCAAVGIRSGVGWVFHRSGGWDHVAPLFDVGGTLEWGETTLEGARFGEHPLAANARLLKGL